jgi:hypothetical protein
VARMGNFVYRLAGDVPTAVLLACKDQLCDPFPAGDVWIVPTRGWTWVQLRGVDVSYTKDDVDYVFEGHQLLAAFAANPCFQGADIMVPPHYQGNPANFKQRTATVIAAISDPDNSRCQRASAEGVCMFGRQVKFVRAGDSRRLFSVPAAIRWDTTSLPPNVGSPWVPTNASGAADPTTLITTTSSARDPMRSRGSATALRNVFCAKVTATRLAIKHVPVGVTLRHRAC